MTTDGKLLTFKWHDGTEAEEATRRWVHDLGCLEPEIIETTESTVTAKIRSGYVSHILTADMPVELRTVAVTQSKYSREALHDTERKLALAVAQQQAAAAVAQTHAERLVASDAMQAALTRAATAVAESRYHPRAVSRLGCPHHIPWCGSWDERHLRGAVSRIERATGLWGGVEPTTRSGRVRLDP